MLDRVLSSSTLHGLRCALEMVIGCMEVDMLTTKGPSSQVSLLDNSGTLVLPHGNSNKCMIEILAGNMSLENMT